MLGAGSILLPFLGILAGILPPSLGFFMILFCFSCRAALLLCWICWGYRINFSMDLVFVYVWFFQVSCSSAPLFGICKDYLENCALQILLDDFWKFLYIIKMLYCEEILSGFNYIGNFRLLFFNRFFFLRFLDQIKKCFIIWQSSTLSINCLKKILWGFKNVSFMSESKVKNSNWL